MERHGMHSRLIPFFTTMFVAISAACGPTLNDRIESMSATTSVSSDEALQSRFSDTPAVETIEGDATYYADFYEGRTTANGDVYDSRAFTAASPTLPFGTIARVVRVDTGASVIVRVNDRTGGGPTLIDLSRIAAERLEMIDDGRVPVRLEIVARTE